MELKADDLQLLYRYCYSLTQDQDDAFDLLQNGIEKWLKTNQSRDVGIGYLRRIIRNHFIDECRRLKRVAFEPFADTTPTMLAADSIEQTMISQQEVTVLMERLNTGERETLFLWAVMEYTAEEIAKETNSPRGTILSRLYRIKRKVADLAIAADGTTKLGRNA